MSEAKEKDLEVDQISAEDLDTVAGGAAVLGLQKQDGAVAESDEALSSAYSVFCDCSGSTFES